MTSARLTDAIRRLGDFAEIRGAFTEAAIWRRIATDLDRRPDDIARLSDRVRRSEFESDPSLQSLEPRVREVLREGPDVALDAARAQLPRLLRRLLEIGELDSAQAAALAREGIVTVDDLSLALHDGRINDRFPSLANRLDRTEGPLRAERQPTTLGRAVELLENLMLAIAAARPDLSDLTPAGDVRRAEPVVEALSIVGSAGDPAAALEGITELPIVRLLHRSNRRAVVEYQQREIDIRFAAPDEYGTALYVATGSREHLIAVDARQGTHRLASREEDVYAGAGLSWIAPELRRGADEIEAAAARRLPRLVSREDIRGDLHTHTIYSDGRDSVAEMVRRAAMLGYEYIAITDHSEGAAASRTMDRNALLHQRDEIEKIRRRFPQLAILHGAEVDIMPDGSLDFPDDVLETLDIVLASLHDRHGHDPVELTRRCIAAIHHPFVNIITHPANRLVGRDAGYDLDFPAIYAAAAASGTALEIDGAPTHLDLDGDRAREAVARGVTVTIDSDCHNARLLDRQMRLGIGTARRGWVEAHHVLNTRPLDELRAFLSRKRSQLR